MRVAGSHSGPIAAETGIPAEALAAAARNVGIPVQHGMNGHAHPLAGLGGPGAFPPTASLQATAKAMTEAEEQFRQTPNLASGHVPMFSQPAAVADYIIGAATSNMTGSVASGSVQGSA